jgi:putative pyruvate formate lyase activating enzyme
MELCNICPRKCGADREKNLGFCRAPKEIMLARAALHHFEEPPISGRNGSGTVFFSGCSLRCVFCQNKDISRRGGVGKEISDAELAERMLELQDSGVHNVNLVTAAHFVHRVAPILERLKKSGELRIPVVYNSSGYESLETLRRLDGLIDIYMPDLKYFSSKLSGEYSSAPDYYEVASRAICEMHRQVGKYEYLENEPDILKSGLIVRHLVLPGCREDSIAVLEHLSALLPADDILLSLMSQYTPEFATDTPYKNLHRRVTTFEYSSVVKRAEELGFDGFVQDKRSASSSFTPDFS